ncbi:MAG: Abi family protein [Bacilli bacterium]|nr:Abi family protein [Bacilli bacterium]
MVEYKILTSEELVNHLKEKNIKFNYISEEDAVKYLKKNNSYYNLTSYLNNFKKYPSPAGRYEGMYIDLDFAYLKDMAIVDYRLRLILFKMTTAIEHHLKLEILNNISKYSNDNGLSLVNSYLEKDFNDELFPKKIHHSIIRKVDSDYYKKLFNNYDIDGDKKLENIPLWLFLEVITFGELVRFYEYYARTYSLKKIVHNIHNLKDIVKLRNACAHNTNILNDLNQKNHNVSLNYDITRFLEKCNINKKSRHNKMSNARVRQITCTLFVFNEIVISEGVRKSVKNALNKFFFIRIKRNKKYYNNNELLISVYKYFEKIIGKIY